MWILKILKWNHQRLVRDLQLRGTVYELLIRNSSEWADADRFGDSPALMRYAMDLRQALVLEGWQPPRIKKRDRASP